MKLPRRRFLHLAACAVTLPAGSRVARSQNYPARPVRIIVGFSAGGTTDIIARLIAQGLSERLGQQFIIENRPGASANLATEAVVRAPPDGYTLLAVVGTNAINATLYDKLSFNLNRDIAPVAGLTRSPLVLEVHPSVPAKTVPELVTYAKAQGQDHDGVVWRRLNVSRRRRVIQDDGWRRLAPRAVSWFGPHAH